MTNRKADELMAGQQLGNLEYVVDEGELAKYRKLVGRDGSYPNLMAEDCQTLLKQRTAHGPLTTVWQRFRFMRPPVLGRRIQVGGWLRECHERHGLSWFWVTAFAVDEIGTEIMRSEAAMVAGEIGRQASYGGDAGVLPPTSETSVRLADALPGGHVLLEPLTIAEPPNAGAGGETEEARSVGSTVWDCSPNTIVAGWLEDLLGREFGDDFRWGGSLSLAHHSATGPGDVLAGDAVTMARDVDASGVVTRKITIAVQSGPDKKVATAEASVTVPSPRLL